MKDGTLTRRRLLRAAAVVGGSQVLPQFAVAATSSQMPSYLPAPPQVATLFSKPYGRARLGKVQQAVKRAGLDALIVTNRCLDYLGYVSNFHPFPLEPGLALIPAEGPTVLFVTTYSSAHTRAVASIAWVDDFVEVPHDDVSEGSNQKLFDFCIQRLRDRRLERGRIGLAGDETDWIAPYYFRSNLPDAHFEDAARVLVQVIAVKDEVELALIRFAQRFIDEIAYPTFQQVLRPGVIDHEVFGHVMGNMLQRGASPGTVLLFDAGPAGAGTWANGPSGRRLNAGDIVLSEPTPSVAWYQSEKMFAFALGRNVPESQKRGAEVVYEAFNRILEQLKPGKELTPIIDSLDAFMRSRGYDGCTVPVGHWIGTQNHEGPRFTHEGTRGWVLQENMVMSWHPNIVIPGKVRTTCSTCVLITAQGAIDLSRIKMEPMYFV